MQVLVRDTGAFVDMKSVVTDSADLGALPAALHKYLRTTFTNSLSRSLVLQVHSLERIFVFKRRQEPSCQLPQGQPGMWGVESVSHKVSLISTSGSFSSM